jgi:c-di-GMP-binding flagellar brake protein YcgR
MCKISFQKNGHCHIFNTRIVRVIAAEKLLLLFKRAKVNTDVREYFRVDALGNVCCQKLGGQRKEIFDYRGLINISGGGLRFPTRRLCRLGEQIRIGLVFNNPYPVMVECIGEVVRALNFGKNPYVALKFSEIDPKERKKLIAFCMAVQREYLRTKVHVVSFL